MKTEPADILDPTTAPLDQLRKLLKRDTDRRPKYLFRAVEKAEALEYRYVFWLDLMGAKNAMKLSLPRAARSIMKIHAAALAAMATAKGVEINPVMDGVYGYGKNRSQVEEYLKCVLSALAHVFVLEALASNRFMVRAGLAFGPLVSGKALAAGSDILTKNKEYLGGTAIGMAISHAYEAESHAPPFGVYVHESARAFAPSAGFPYRTNLWHWFDDDEPLTWGLKRTLLKHFDWVHRNPVASQYEASAAEKHKALAVEYFDLHQIE